MFLTREPVVHQMTGSTTCALNLLELLAGQGAEVTMVSTSAFSRSPRLWFRVAVPPPKGVKLFAPGFLRLGKTYLNFFSLKAWARLLVRVSARTALLSPLRWLIEVLYGDALYSNAWDLTMPTQAEREVSLRVVRRRDATTVIVNYAFWGPLFDESAIHDRKRVVLMHDLLSARVQRFLETGTPLDCPVIDEETEMSWLNRADCVLAAQAREAEYVQPKVNSKVLVQPIVLKPQPSETEPMAQRCLFVGSNVRPNTLGMEWLLEEVWPAVLAANPQATLAVAGTVCEGIPSGVQGVLKLGVVPALEDEYYKAAVVLVPLLFGTGIKIKLIEALSFGKATVSTSVGVQGLEEWVTGAIEVSDTAVGFAAAIVGLLDDRALRKQREAAAIALVKERFGAGAELGPEFVERVL